MLIGGTSIKLCLLVAVTSARRIKTKTVAQCVEFYYTYKKQVKIGRNGALIFGDVDATTERAVKDEAEVDIKSSHRLTRTLPPRTYNEDYENTDDEEDEEEREEELTIKEEIIEEEELQVKNSSITPSKPTQVLHTKDQAGSILSERGPGCSQEARSPSLHRCGIMGDLHSLQLSASAAVQLLWWSLNTTYHHEKPPVGQSESPAWVVDITYAQNCSDVMTTLSRCHASLLA
ncbi:UNVERIFIED_CONTAM: hypothetical protein K2H54_050349 [Gekko kuhli]